MRIKRCRLSCVWADAIPELLHGNSHGPLSVLMDSNGYSGIFNRLLAGNQLNLVDLPWPRKPGAIYPEKNSYWTDALISNLRKHSGGNRARIAWKSAIQLRHKDELFKVTTVDRCFVEGWYFPHGVALSVTVWLAGNFDGNGLEQAVSDFLGGPLTVTWSDGVPPVPKLEPSARAAMDILRAKGFGLSESDFAPESIKILTVISAEHDPQEKDKAAAEGEILTAVLASVGGNPSSPVTPVKNIYALPHARVIWRPDCFLSNQKGLHKLGCLHRNVTMATLHLSSLLGCADAMVTDFVQNGSTPAGAAPYERAVAGLFGRIYGSQDDDTKKQEDKQAYRQQCLRSQIDEAIDTVNQLRFRVEMPALK
jgi:hypothetical protein